jgi:putative phage-type endonuclease
MTISLEQLKMRKTGIGGSDAAAVLGVSRFKTPLDIYFDKLNDQVEEKQFTPAQEWGIELEPIIIKKFAKETGLNCVLAKDTFRHPENNFMLANVDALIPEQNAILECKTTNVYRAKEWSEEGGDNIPDEYLIQCAHYAEVLNVSKVYIAVLIGGSDFRIYHYDRNDKLGNVIITKEKEFWEKNVIAKVPPTPIYPSETIKLWQHKANGSSKIATEEIITHLRELKTIKSQIKTLQEAEKQRALEVFNFMQEAEALVDGLGRPLASWKMQNCNRFDNSLFKAEHTDLYSKYTKQSQNRVFKLKEANYE